jgi:hypothetical protein
MTPVRNRGYGAAAKTYRAEKLDDYYAHASPALNETTATVKMHRNY